MKIWELDFFIANSKIVGLYWKINKSRPEFTNFMLFYYLKIAFKDGLTAVNFPFAIL